MKRLLPLALLALAGCYPDHPSARYLEVGQILQPIDFADIAGTWYEIAKFPMGYEAGCTRTQATYTPQADGTIAILNQCQRGGQTVQIAGVATVAGPGQLKVRLDGVPLAGDLYVLGVADGGRTLFLGTHYRETGFVLHRDRHMTPAQIDRAEEVFRKNGYDVAALQRTSQR